MFRGAVKKKVVITFKASINQLIIVVSGRTCLENLGLSSKDYGLHSMCAGERTMATHFRVKKRLIKKHWLLKMRSSESGVYSPYPKNLLLVSQNLVL